MTTIFTYKRQDLFFKRPAGTSRGVLVSKPTWFVVLAAWGRMGHGEVSLIPGLSLDREDAIEDELDRISNRIQTAEIQQQIKDLTTRQPCRSLADYQVLLEEIAQLIDIIGVSLDGDFPAVRFAMEMVLLNFCAAQENIWFDTCSAAKQEIPINGLIWMGDESFMRQQIEEKLEQGYGCLKLKIGAIDFIAECRLLEEIRTHFSKHNLELRVDANGAFSPSEALDRLRTLSQFELHSIEQPIRQGQWPQMARLCEESPLAIALDEELIGIDKAEQHALLDCIKPQFIIVKPSLLGGFHHAGRWITLAESKGIKSWTTSALESSLGLQAIVQWTALYNPEMPQGLGTGSLFRNNLPCSLIIKDGFLSLNNP